MRKNTIIVAALCFSSLLQAQQDTTTREMNEVIITATRYPKKQSETGKVVTVITSQQIEQSAGKDLAQLLNEQTGITVNGANSSPGKDKSLFLRGASSNYTLYLLDGVPLNDPSGVGGSFDIRLIPLEMIERIEIVKGSQSTLYGSNAMAGVINIISKKAVSEQTSGSGLLSYGSYNSMKGAANFNRKGKTAEYNLAYEYFDTKGITEAKDTSGKGNFDRDGFNRQTLQANLGFNVSSNIKLSPYYRYSAYKGEYDANAFTDGKRRYTASLVNTGLIASMAYDRGSLQLNYGYDYTQRDYNNYPFKGKFHHADAFVNHNFSELFHLVAGLNYQQYKIAGVDTTNSIFSPYASFFINTRGLNVELGGRFNHHNQVGDHFTYSFSPSYLVQNRIKIFASATTGFRAPGIHELFGPFGANPQLKPESSKTLEGGIQTWTEDKKISLLATYFKRSIKNVIIYDLVNNFYGYNNRDQQRDYGAELEVKYAPNDQLNFRASYAYIDGEITQKLQAKDTTFFNLIRRPKHTVNLFAGYQLNKNLFFSTSLQSQSKRSDNYYHPITFSRSEVELKAYALWNAYAEYSFSNNAFKLFADAKNLTNKKDYYEVYGYNVQGFTINGGVRFKL